MPRSIVRSSWFSSSSNVNIEHPGNRLVLVEERAFHFAMLRYVMSSLCYTTLNILSNERGAVLSHPASSKWSGIVPFSTRRALSGCSRAGKFSALPTDTVFPLVRECEAVSRVHFVGNYLLQYMQMHLVQATIEP